jgi:hypothetical protein
MANVLFRRGDQTYINNNVPLVDGQVIFNETDQAIYMDEASSGTLTRIRYGGGNLSRSDVDSTLSTSSTNPIQNQAVATALNGKAPTSHASTATTYGIGTTTNYGHCMTINDLNSSSYANGKALSAYQGKVLNDKITKTEVLASNTQNALAIVENGNTCTHTGGISKGQYVCWKGSLYTADSNISVGATFASSGGSKNLTAVADGGLNDLNESLKIKVCNGTLGATVDTLSKICDYPNGKSQSNFIYMSYRVTWGDASMHSERADITIVLLPDGIYSVCTSSAPLNLSIKIYYF